MKRYNVFITGVGGQGLLTIGRLLGYAAIEAGMDVTIAEVHGLSQRGGSLNVQVRIGEGEAPLIPSGGVDLYIALEAIEAVRYIRMANAETRIVINNFLWPPPLSRYPSLDEIVARIKEVNRNVFVFDANAVSKEVLGTIISANIAIVGFSYAVDPGLRSIIEYRHLERGLERIFRGRALELNREVMRRSYEIGLRNA